LLVDTENRRIPPPPPPKKKFSMRVSPKKDQQENKNKIGGPCPEGSIAVPRNTRLEETSWGYRKVEVP